MNPLKSIVHSDPNGQYIWRWDTNTNGTVHGNPASLPCVEGLVCALKHRDGSGDVTWAHSATMTIEHMQSVHEYVKSICPTELTALSTLHDKHIHLKCHYYMAFSTIAWNLWLW